MTSTSRARSPPWVAGCLAAAAAACAGCLEQAPQGDPLRIPWSQTRGAAPAAGAPGAESGDEVRRQELRALHSPLERGDVAFQSAAAGGCRTPTCHVKLAPGTEIHSRIASINCTLCHIPEGEPGKHRFRRVEADGGVCRTCHVPHQGPGPMTGHAPFLEHRCLDCHNPHRNVATQLLAAPGGSGLCAGCHETAHEGGAHAPYAEGRCLACHAAHESEHAGLTRQGGAELCLGCHDREIDVSGRERPLPDMAALICTSQFVHGPIRAGECSPCHDSHAAPNANLLRLPYPKDFYQAWDPAAYALCFQCHATELVTEARTTTRTGFRDGDRNLHHLHVDREKGRSCRACHEVHATNLPFHLRESVPFGQWRLPVPYERRTNGGACSPGCHQKKDYDRTRPPPPDDPTRLPER